MDTSDNSTTSRSIPSSAAISPSAIVLPILAFLASLLCIPPLAAHISARNFAASILVAGVLLINVQNFINALIWPSYPLEGKFDGRGLCDIEVKLYIGIAQAIVGSAASIFRQLAIILDTDNATLVPSKRARYRTRAFEVGLCLVLPAYVMAMHYVVQPTRYILAATGGCVTSYYSSWVTYILILMWPVIICILGVAYCALAIFRLVRYRQSVSSILSSSSSITKARYIRLFGLASGLLIIYLPLALYTLIYSADYVQYPYSWSQIHGSGWSSRILLLNEETEKTLGYRPFDRWCQIATAYVLFLFFGLGHEAVAMYKSWLTKFGMEKCWPGLTGRQPSASSKENRLLTPAAPATSNSSSGRARTSPRKDAFDTELARIDHDLEIELHELESSPPHSAQELPSANKSEEYSGKL